MKVLIFSGSLRKESLNKKLCHVVTLKLRKVFRQAS